MTTKQPAGFSIYRLPSVHWVLLLGQGLLVLENQGGDVEKGVLMMAGVLIC